MTLPAAVHDLVARLPKVELHLHLDGSLRPVTALELGLARGVFEPGTTLAAVQTAAARTHAVPRPGRTPGRVRPAADHPPGRGGAGARGGRTRRGRRAATARSTPRCAGRPRCTPSRRPDPEPGHRGGRGRHPSRHGPGARGGGRRRGAAHRGGHALSQSGAERGRGAGGRRGHRTRASSASTWPAPKRHSPTRWSTAGPSASRARAAWASRPTPVNGTGRPRSAGRWRWIRAHRPRRAGRR